MISRLSVVAAAAVASLALYSRGSLTPAQAAAPAEAGQERATTLDDQIELAVTVYNSDIALVRDVRRLRLPRGASDLRFMDIAATVNPATVHFRSLTEPSAVGVLEQNYEYDLLEPDKLLRKYVGRDVTLVRMVQENGSTRELEVKAHLLSYNSAPVWRIANEIVTGMPADHVRFPELPDTLFTRPTLIWTISNNGAAEHRVEASYLAGKLAWNADYVLRVSRDDVSGDLDGWVTLTNGSGTAFRNASLQLVAGDLNRVRQNIGKMMDEMRMARAETPAPQMAQESFSEYHLYTLNRKTTINNNQTKQVTMLQGTGVPVRKRCSSTARRPTAATHSIRAPLKDVVRSTINSSRTTAGARACRCRPATCASTRRTPRAARSSSARIGSITRRRTKPSTSKSATPSTSSPSGNRPTSRRSRPTSTRSSTRSRYGTTSRCR
jgi:hypothetical protein